METLEDRPSTPVALRVTDVLLWVALGIVVLVAGITAVFSIGKGLIGGSPLYLTGETSDVVVEFISPDGLAITQDLAEPLDPDQPYPDPRFLSANVQAAATDAGPRVIIALNGVVRVALLAVGVVSAMRLVRSSRRGQVFTLENAGRISRLAWVVLALPLVDRFLGDWVLNSFTDAGVGVSGFMVDRGGDNLAIWIVAGLLLHVFARAFRYGVELQELDAATI